MIEFKKYIDTTVDNVKIKMTISFNRYQTNWATNEPIKVGYRLTATPITRENKGAYNIESFGAFTGFGDNLLPCKRRSSKRLDEAIDKLEENMGKYIQYFEERGIKFKKELRDAISNKSTQQQMF